MASTSSLTLSRALLARAISQSADNNNRLSLSKLPFPAFSGLKSTSRVSTSSRRRLPASHHQILRPIRAAAVETVDVTTETSLVDKSVNTIRFLAIDAVEKANSGHPGLPMGCAPMGHILYDEVMRYNPKNPYWFNRDRFVLSAGHGCMLQYAFLHLAGYDSVLTLSSTISRLSLLRKPSFCYPYKQLTARRPTWSPPKLSSLSNRFFCSKNGGQLDVSSKDDLIVLGIETSCDDTAAAVVRGNGVILSQVVSSQADLLVQYGGVAPKMAEEAHSLAIDPVVREALDKAKLTEKDLSAVAVTIGPGLSLCLRVGVQKARKIAGCFNLPVVGVHHMEAHAIVARLIERELQFPFLALLISGGHNLLVLAHDLGQYTQLGTTIDDAIGEAFDKTAKWLGLDMRRSGGPAVEELALEGDAESVKFSTPMKQHKDCNFSYAGLKTQVRLAIESRNIDAKIPISSASCQDRSSRADVAASFQRVAVLHLEERCERAIEWALKIEPSIKHLVISGGVASNKYVRARLDQVVKKNSLQLVCPPPSLCTDNGVMVAWTGIENFCMGRYDPPPPANDPEDFVYDLRPRWPLGKEYAEGRSKARSMRKARIHPSLTSLVQASVQQQS